jgi:hypothetical protein
VQAIARIGCRCLQSPARALGMEANHAIALRIVFRFGRMQPCDIHRCGTVECEPAREPVAQFAKNRHVCLDLIAAGRDVGRKFNGACCASFVRSRARCRSAACQCDNEPITIRARVLRGRIIAREPEPASTPRTYSIGAAANDARPVETV